MKNNILKDLHKVVFIKEEDRHEIERWAANQAWDLGLIENLKINNTQYGLRLEYDIIDKRDEFGLALTDVIYSAKGWN